MQNDLKFTGVTPVIINYNGSTDDIYAPIKTSSCDVNIVSSHILDDLYTARKDEIAVTVGKKEPKKIQVVEFTSDGSVVSTQISSDITEQYSIYNRNLFYQDIAGVFRFNGQIMDTNNNIEDVNLRYDTSLNKWKRENPYNMATGDGYFYDDNNNWYVIHYNGSNWTIRNGNGTPVLYNVGGSSETTPSVSNIVHYSDGEIELLFGNKRYTWDYEDMEWDLSTPFVDSEGNNYDYLYGQYFFRIKNKEGQLVDAVIVNGVYDTEYSNWIATIEKEYDSFTRIIPLTDESWNMDRVFTNDGAVYYVDNSGYIYYWSWDIEQWVRWIQFTGIQTNSLGLDYVIINGDKNIVVLSYSEQNVLKYFQLKDFEEPTVEVVEHIVPGEYVTSTIWEGYKMPNTYSQDVTQNLDTISMVCIDPVSIMKYVKIDKILTRPAVYTYGELIGKSLAYVKLHSNRLLLERTVTYGDNHYYGNNGLFDIQCQVSNFWDESGDPSSIYEMIEEMLRPFCLTLAYVDDTYQIYNTNRTEGDRVFDEFAIGDDGTLTHIQEVNEDYNQYDFDDDDWKSNNVQNAAIEIGPTYDKITGIASTNKPSFSNMAMDLIDYTQTDKYSIGYLNVQRNKSKGWKTVNNNKVLDDADYWFYIWNGVYVNPDYDLGSYLDPTLVNAWMNINKAYYYLTDDDENPNDIGSILNFYGGANNPTGTGKQQDTEKSVEVKKRITAYSYDNGVPPEFLENTDLNWTLDNPDFEHNVLSLNKTDGLTNQKFGIGIIDTTDPTRVVYHQVYENIPLSATNSEYTVDMTLTQAYSRTGINVPINVMNNNSNPGAAQNNQWYLEYDDEVQKFMATINTAPVNYFPNLWNADEVEVSALYFQRYRTASNQQIKPVWDRRRVYLYVTLPGGTIYQYNGQDWVQDTQVRDSNTFFICKLMNYNKLYNKDYQYNLIEFNVRYEDNVRLSDMYSLTDDDIVYYTDDNGAVVKNPSNSDTSHTFHPYKSAGYVWEKWINKCNEGNISIRLPEIDASQATVVMDITCSSMLGMTGSDTHTESGVFAVPVNYQVVGTGSYTYEGQTYTYTLNEGNTQGYGEIKTSAVTCNFLPANVSHVKAEHLDLSISVNVPESNIGQMFSESDIKYTIDDKRNYAEEFQGPTFRCNTYNNLVSSSFSYLLFGNNISDPQEFYIGQVSTRPEAYTIQAYFNWLSAIRKSYSKTLVPLKTSERQFSNVRTFITSPEVGENKLMVVSDSWDLKSNRHTIKAVECQNLDVDNIRTVDIMELPHKARNDWWNLPTVKK